MSKKRAVRIAGIALGVLLAAFLLYCFVPVALGPVASRAQTKVLSGSGEVMYALGAGRPSHLMTEKELRALPPYVVQALIAAEDQRFFSHPGIDLGAILGSRGQRGASTITSQVIKVRYFPGEARTLLQKAREFTLAVAFSALTSKEAMLADYLNYASFGGGYTGLWAASEGYFGKAPSMLSLGEAALLVGVLPAPETYGPTRSFEGARERQKIVLQRMVTEGYLNHEEMDAVLAVPVFIQPQEQTILAPHAVHEALAEARRRFPDVDQGGYTIHTGINLAWHREMATILQRDIGNLKGKNVTNGAAVVMDPATGAVRVMIGSKDYFAPGGAYNVAMAKRQPGSSLKPFTYLAAFLQGRSPASIVHDVETSFATAGEPYIPRNYDLKFHGPVSMRAALGSSLNIPAVKTLEMVGFEAWYNLLARFGLTFLESPEYYGLGITLGGGEVTLKELTHAYSMLANGGQKTGAYIVERIEKDGQTVYTPETLTGSLMPEDRETFEGALQMVNDVLRDNTAREISFGLASRLYVTDAVAVKTGTTKDYRDNWAFGYTPAIAVGVWVGNNDNTPMEGVTGITGAIPVLHDFLRLRTRETASDTTWPSSPLVIQRRVCTLSGMLATPLCPVQREELFLTGKEPQEEDTWYRSVQIDRKTGLVVDETCPGDTVTKTFVQVPPELQRWASSVLLESAPTKSCSGRDLTPLAEVWSISQPKQDDVYIIRKDLPKQAQRIPVHIDGQGRLQTTLHLDGKPLLIEGVLPITTFIDLEPGEHILTGSGLSLSFSVQTP